MNELRAIAYAWEKAERMGQRTALATLISVEGSAYRRPGARMLMTEDGQAVGSISAGCLEADVVERSRDIIKTVDARIVTYDTRGNEDIVWGLGLGCNGVVRVLIESLTGDGPLKMMSFITERLQRQRRGVIARRLWRHCQGEAVEQHCDVEYFCFSEAELVQHDCDSRRGIQESIRDDAALLISRRRSLTRAYPAGQEVFFDIIQPPKRIVVMGAEPDALPLVEVARHLGWEATVVDTRCRACSHNRFTLAHEVILCRPEDVARKVSFNSDCAAVIMTHNYLADVELLRTLLPSPASYVGILGPKARTENLLDQLRREGCAISSAELARLHAPIGIDIGAETPAEVALSIVAEIRAVDAGHAAGFLRDRAVPIHDHPLSLPLSFNGDFLPSAISEPGTIATASRARALKRFYPVVIPSGSDIVRKHEQVLSE